MEGQDRAFDRAIDGYWRPRFYRDRLIGHVHDFDNAMVMDALRHPPAARK
jgi:hypothetical protein